MWVVTSKAGHDPKESLREDTGNIEDCLVELHLYGQGCSRPQGWEYEAYYPLEGYPTRTPIPLFIEHKHNTASG
jgi:hypothetical protein